MVRVWWVNQYAITPDLPGGTRHIDLGRELVRLGHQVSIFASDVNLGLRERTKLGVGERHKLEVIDGVRFHWLRAALYRRNNWRRAWNMLSFAWTFLLVASGLGERPDVVIGSSPHPFAALAAWCQARRFNVPFWLELRDLWPQALMDMGGFRESHPAVRAMRLLERFLYSRAAKIIILAEGSRDYLLARGVTEEKIVFLPNGVRLSDFPALGGGQGEVGGDGQGIGGGEHRRARARQRYGMEGFTVVYTGAHGPANALETVLEAARILEENSGGGERPDEGSRVVLAGAGAGCNPGGDAAGGADGNCGRLESAAASGARPGDTAVRFLMVGDGPAKEGLVQRAEALGLTNLRFLDPVPKVRVPDLLWAADAAVITLRDVAAFSYAVSPNKLFDYLAAGKPVLAAVPGAMAQMVAAAGTGYVVPPEDPGALAAAVLRLAALPVEERRDMGRRGRELVEKEFSREKLAGRLGALLAEAVPVHRG